MTDFTRWTCYDIVLVVFHNRTESCVSLWIALPIVRIVTQVRDNLQIDDLYTLTSQKSRVTQIVRVFRYYITFRPCHRWSAGQPLANVTWSEAIACGFSILSHVRVNDVVSRQINLLFLLSDFVSNSRSSPSKSLTGFINEWKI